MVKTESVPIAVCMILISLGFLGIFTDGVESAGERPTAVYVVDPGGGEDFTTIMDAVNFAKDGDRIFVNPGTYNEQVSIAKNGISLIGSGPDSTIIDPGSGSIGFGIGGQWINVSGFNIKSTNIGISISASRNCHVDSVIVNGNGLYGIEFITSYYCNISNSEIGNNGNIGIRMQFSNNNKIFSNKIFQSDNGVVYFQSTNNIATLNRINDSYRGVKLESSSHGNKFYYNNISSNRFKNIESQDSNNLVFKINHINDSIFGVDLLRSRGSFWDSNVITGSSLNFMSNLSSGMRFTNNKITSGKGQVGIRLLDQSGDVILNNEFIGAPKSIIEMIGCQGETFMDNRFTGAGIRIQGDDILHWNTHYIDTTNTVNGKVLRYFKNQTTGTVGQSSGQIILANCSGLNIRDQNISSTRYALQIGYSSDNMIRDSNFSYNYQGVQIFRSTGNEFENVTMWNNSYIGIVIDHGSLNIMTNSSLGNSLFGIFIQGSSGNELRTNEITGIANSAVYLTSHRGMTCDGNVVDDNFIEGCSNGINSRDSTASIISNNSISQCGLYAIRFAESDPILEGSNITIIDNNLSLNDYGISVGRGIRNVTISGNSINDHSEEGITLYQVQNLSILNNEISDQNGIGISIFDSDNITIEGNFISNNDLGGILMEHSGNSTISNNNVSNDGAQISAIELNTVLNATIHSNYLLNHSVGFTAYTSDDLTVYDNYFDNDVNLGSVSSSTNIVWNIPKTFGLNILGGFNLGGNYWNDYGGLDTDGDWIGDTMVPHGPGDELPLQYDLIAPDLIDTTSTGIAYTGAPYNFSVIVDDERPYPGRAYLEWQVEDGPLNNVMMEYKQATGEFQTSVMMPEDRTGEINYRFRGTDEGNNWNSIEGIAQVELQDGIAPIFGNILVPDIILLYKQIPISIVVTDNIEIALVTMTYLDVNGVESSKLISQSEPGIFSGTIPGQERKGHITFWFTALDSSGNSNQSEEYTVTVWDGAPPAAIFIQPADGSIHGNQVAFWINITDPIGVPVHLLITASGPLDIEIFNRTPTGDLMTITWNTTDVPEGNYSISLYVADDGNNSNETSIEIIIDHTKPIPVINGTFDVFVDTIVRLDSYGTIEKYGIGSIEWGIGEWAPGLVGEQESPEAEFLFRDPGEYRIWLQVTDTAGNVNRTTALIRVYLPSGPRIVITTPTNNQKGVLIDEDIIIMFDMPMNRSSIENNMHITPTVTYTVKWNNASTEMTIIIPGGMEYETVYRILFTGGSAADSRVPQLSPKAINFTTENSPPSPSIIIISPSAQGDYITGMSLSMSGFAYNLPEGTVLIITIDDRTWNAEVDSNGSWRSNVILPDKVGTYRITVEGGGVIGEVTIEVGNAPKEKFSMNASLAYFLVAILLLIVLAVSYVAWRRNRDKEFEFDDWAEE